MLAAWILKSKEDLKRDFVEAVRRYLDRRPCCRAKFGVFKVG